MQTIRVRSRVGADGNLQLHFPEQLANQEIDVVIVYQSVQPTEPPTSPIEEALLIGLFSGSPDLATRSEKILQKEINQTSGWTGKQS
jgi:hypothetical protein